jgi:hypothetical protein
VIETATALGFEISGDMAVGDRRDQRDRHDGTADEKHEQAATEPAPQRPGL